jgi:hypothetical protein
MNDGFGVNTPDYFAKGDQLFRPASSFPSRPKRPGLVSSSGKSNQCEEFFEMTIFERMLRRHFEAMSLAVSHCVRVVAAQLGVWHTDGARALR